MNTEKELTTEGENFFKQGKYKAAEKKFADILQLNPKSTNSYFFLANIFHLNGEIGKAIKAFSKVLSFDPNHTDAAISLSVLYNDIGKYDDAKKIFEQANARVKSTSATSDSHINKKFALKHYELADMYLAYNRHDEALFEYNKSIGLNPNNLDARIKIAKVYAKKGFISKAFEELRTLKNEHPSHIPTHVALGVLYYGNGKIIEAQSEWNKAIIKDPLNSEAAMYLNLSKTATESTL